MREWTLKDGSIIQYVISTNTFDELKEKYENKPEYEYNYEDFIKEDRDFWINTPGGVEPNENFRILESQKDRVIFVELIINKEVVSRLAFQYITPKIIYIFWFYTKKAWRDKGISQLFLNKVLTVIQKNLVKGKIGLRVDEDNLAGRHIYQKLGFIEGPTDAYVELTPNAKPEVELILTQPVNTIKF